MVLAGLTGTPLSFYLWRKTWKSMSLEGVRVYDQGKSGLGHGMRIHDGSNDGYLLFKQGREEPLPV
jgi:hypothetical protein